MNRKFIHTANGVKTLRVVLMAMAMFTSVTAMADDKVKVHGNVYGGGNAADVGGTATVNISAGQIGDAQIDEEHGNVFGGGKGKITTVVGNVEVNVGKKVDVNNNVSYSDKGIVKGSVYGGSALGAVNGTKADNWDENNLDRISATSTTTTDVNIYGGTVNGDVYGGGRGQTGDDAIAAKSFGAVTVTIGDVDVDKTIQVDGSVYGGSNLNGVLESAAVVEVIRGTIGKSTTENETTTITGGNVHGGGYGQPTLVQGDVTVNIGDETSKEGYANILGDVYGGSAQGNVNATWGKDTENNDVLNPTSSTTKTYVNLYGGTVNGDVYGGGLGAASIAANVYGKVTVNVGTGTVDATTGFATATNGTVTIGGSVYGCNNANGSPQGDVSVNIFKTYQAETATMAYVPDEGGPAPTYAIYQVFGGGNQAAYSPATVSSGDPHIATVHIYTCDNTVETVYGGGNAADATNVKVIIDGGRFGRIFGGGNGYSETGNHTNSSLPNYNPGANISGTATTEIHGGQYGQVFGGSNQCGNVVSASLTLDNTSSCELAINESFGGANEAEITGDVTTNLACSSETSSVTIGSFYGGSNKADINGNVTLNVFGGTYTNVFGGSKGTTPASNASDEQKAIASADITGNVTLNLYGGTITDAAYGGSDVYGKIDGKITVNVLNNGGSCSLSAENIYGGGRNAAYEPTYTVGEEETRISPIVNIIHGSVSNVFGGAKGETATVTSCPQVNIGYDATTMGDLNTENTLLYQLTHGVAGYTSTTTPAEFLASVTGNVYGGGDLAQVAGNTTVYLRKANSSVGGSLFGGGNEADVSGNTTVNINDGTVTQDIYGGGALANVGTADASNTTQVTVAGGTVGNVYGGGLGRNADNSDTDNPISAVEAKVFGAVIVDINGGTVSNVFGCNNYNGAPQSTVQVNIEQTASSMSVTNVYGGGNLAAYTYTTDRYPEVNIKNGTVSGNVYGGGKGESAVVTGNPVVTIGDATASHTAIVSGDVYGGGDAAAVTGNTTVTYNDNGESSTVGRLFGGGNAAGVSGTSTVTMTLGKVTTGIYGGCNSSGSVGAVTIALNGGQVGTDATHTADVYGGGLGSSTTTTGNIDVTLGTDATIGTTVYGDIYGGSALGSVNASASNTTTVTLTSATLYGKVFGGGKGDNADDGDGHSDVTATSNGGATVNINVANLNVTGIYGGANVRGSVKDAIAVNINANVGASGNTLDIFGGGYGANTNTEGNVTVTIGDAAGTYQPEIFGDIYGGSALGNVNNEASDITTVNFLNGTLHGDLYGGGLGNTDNAAKVNGQVIVNISNETQDADNCHIDLSDASIFGCNNANGSPQDGVTVNIYKTAHTSDNGVDGTAYAIDQVFGGGDQADYAPENGSTSSTKKATVKIYGCNNTIRRVFGGGNAAAAVGVVTRIEGGHFDYVYGGGNGEVTAANIGAGGTNLQIHGGTINNLFGGSNAQGTISGDMGVNVDNSGPCSGAENMYVNEFFCGNNLASIGTAENPVTINATIACGTRFGAVYGGCNLAPLYGSVNLTVEGGIMDYVYGGSKGRLADNSDSEHPISAVAADISGNVTLTIKGGQIKNVFGGSNINGNIAGTITVNIEKDDASTCADGWYVGNVYGGSNLAAYTPTTSGNYPAVNIKNGTVSGNVYGGGKGASATVTSNPVVTIGDVTNDNYVAIVADKDGDKDVENNDLVGGNVYGGGDAAAVVGNTKVIYNDTHTSSNVANIFGGGNEADVTNTAVEISAGQVNGNVYGGGNLGDVGTINKTGANYNYTWTGNTSGNNTISGTNSNTGICTVTISGGTIGTGVAMSADGTFANGNVFGAGKGTGDNTFYCEKGMVYATSVSISAGTVKGTVYGGGEVGRVEDDTKVTIDGTNEDDTNIIGNVFGAGKGLKTHGYSALVRGNTSVTVRGKAKVEKSVYGGGEIASVGRFKVENDVPTKPQSGGACAVTVQGNAIITGDVFGAGKGITPAFDGSDKPKKMTGTGLVTIDTEADYLVFLKTLALASAPSVTIDGSAQVNGSVYGGGERGITLGSVAVNVNGGTVTNDVYGGGKLADTNTGNWHADFGEVEGLTAGTSVVTGYYTRSGESPSYTYTEITTEDQTAASGTTYYSKDTWAHATQKSAWHTTTVSLTGGTVGNAYGGALGDANTPAYVWGDVLVDLNGTTTYDTDGNVLTTPITGKGCVVGKVFGCNNVHGTPKGEVTVHVHATQKSGKETIGKTDKVEGDYDVQAVYGGGNLAEYWPVAAKANGTDETEANHIHTNVIIDGCDYTSIETVYGGGNAASTPATCVTVNGAYEIDEVFGGGNGKDAIDENTPNPGAHVGFHKYTGDSDKANQKYGFGKAQVNIGGGIIHEVYGGSNAKGNVREVAIAMLDKKDDTCDFAVGKAYGGGKAAEMDGRAVLQLGCVASIDEVYGGAESAAIHNDVELTITNGTYKRIFGGNNKSGSIDGKITINVEETGCTPIIIGQIFAGGNEAAYTTPEGKDDPVINVKSFTSIGEIYGGGFGPTAVLTGNPTININEIVGDKATAYEVATFEYNKDTQDTSDDYTVSVPAHTADKIGTIGDVYGGGYGADVDGNVTVNIGTQEKIELETTPHRLGITADADGKYTVTGVDIARSVYGGGYGAATTVTGDVKVNVGGEKTEGSTTTYIGGNIAIGGSVYGGSALGAVNASTTKNTAGEITAYTPTENATTIVTLKKGTVSTSVFGGGQGNANTQAKVYGKAIVNFYGEVIAEGLYGGCDANGEMFSDTELNLLGGRIGNSFTSVPEGGVPEIVFGGGLGANTIVDGIVTVNVGSATGGSTIYSNVYGGSKNGSVAVANVKLLGGTIWGNVFGGGYQTADGKTAATDVNVTLDGTKFACLYSGTGDDAVPQTGQIFGCNNLKGTPTGHVKVWVKKTVDSDKVGTTALTARTTYDVAAVYGGGNKADYVPIADDNTEVLIEGCELTSINAVYGGGNAAAVPATNVTVNGSYIINRLYGGGNGAGEGNPGADVGKHIVDNVSTNYGTGKAITKLNGGYINSVFGGSNTKGDIVGGTDVQTKGKNETAPAGSCPNLIIGNLYGAGSHADVEGDVNIILECMPEDYVAAVYGGAEEATIKGNVSLTVTSGKFGRVFGGNNKGGSINGTITVNVKEEGCKDLEIGELFGAGNEAPYSKYGCYYDNTDEKWKAYESKSTANDNFEVTIGENELYPYHVKVLVESCTSIGRIFGGGLGSTATVNGDTYVNVNMMYGRVGEVDKTTLGHIGQVFGGGKEANVKGDTRIDIGTATATSGQDVGVNITKTIGEADSDDYNKTKYLDPDNNSYIALEGAVYGGGMNANVDGSTTINIGTADQSLGTTIDGSVYGGGKEGDITGDTQVNVCAVKGTGDTYTGVAFAEGAKGVTITGDVFGAGQGIASDVTKALVEGNTKVVMGNGSVKKSIYGGGELSQVAGDTDVSVIGGTIGTESIKKGGATYGNVYGGGQGSLTKWDAGLIKANTKVTINGGTIYHNIYGGGAYGSVGTITTGSATYVPGKESVSNMPTAWERVAEETTNKNTGTAEVYVYGGTIGIDGDENGMVFGSSRGDVQAPGEDGVDPNDRLAWVYDTKVVIGDEGKSPTIYGSVYGSGENGHVFSDTNVEIHNGTIGVTDNDDLGGPNYRLRGNVYGGGCGEDTYDVGTGDNKKTYFNPLAGIVLGTATVEIDGGQVVHNVYGAGALGSVAGKTTVTVSDDAIIGVEGGAGGSVYGAARGKEGITVAGSNLANSLETEVNIKGHSTDNTKTGAQIWGSVYGGGEAGYVKQGVNVSMTGGVVAKDVYGGGALADTNTETTTTESTTTYPNTKVSLTGGKVNDVYGGGLGRKEATGVTAIEAHSGNVTVELNKGVDAGERGCIVNRVFGCNNLNGSPQGHVKVHVYATQSNTTGNNNIGSKNAKHDGMETEGATTTYDVKAVYGGGNLAAYVPANPATTTESTEVIIEGCDLTSIKQVYGGGNAAPAPATYVRVDGAYEIEELFGGGNGKDNYVINGKYYVNPGANVGYKNYTHLVDGTDGGDGSKTNPYKCVENDNAKTKEGRQAAANNYMYGSGVAHVEVFGGNIHAAYGGSNEKGNISTKAWSKYEEGGDCDLNVAETYGGGKNSLIDGEIKLDLGCTTYMPTIFGGSKDADVNSDIVLNITNGRYDQVFGGNNHGGNVNGSITVNVKENGCVPIEIGELYLGGYLAGYSVYGYNADGTVKESGDRLYADPRLNVISASRIDNVFGGGYKAIVAGNPHVNINMEQGRVEVSKKEKTDADETTLFVEEEDKEYVYKDGGGTIYDPAKVTENYVTLDIGTIGNIYGGGNEADIIGNTYVEIGTGTWVTSWDADGNAVYETISPARNAAKITGNVFGGGKGKADDFKCEKAMIGIEDSGSGSTNVTIGNGTVNGNVYGGGEIGRVEKNTTVTIGLGDGVAATDTPTSAPVVMGSVFGGGKGKETHGYAALVRGNPTVTVQGNAKVLKSVYGGGEIASVARYKVPRTEAEVEAAIAEGYDAVLDMPYALADPNNPSGNCKVIIRGYAEIGPDGMQMTRAGGPDDTGYVFGAGKGILPGGEYAFAKGTTRRMVMYDKDVHTTANTNWTYVDPTHSDTNKNVWEYFADLDEYIRFIQTLALSSYTDVTIAGHAFVKGSVYGGSENGIVQFDTDVKIQGGQIGNGDGVNRRYTEDEWASGSLTECASWTYAAPYAPYDPYANATGNLDQYSNGVSTEGGRRIATDGHTFYGNVFGGGSGSVPYFDATQGRSVYLHSAGQVKGDTKVTISGGHILTNVYGGCEATNVQGTATVRMTDGTIGVPRTDAQIIAHPVTGYLFGAGKGDQRVFFNKDTNVENADVTVEGGRIYGSVYGGGEDGHVLKNVTMTIGKATDHSGPTIGTKGTSYYDGNVFGGGRGFGGEALTAGNVSGTVTLNIEGGTMLGSVYGGGRLASVGYGLYLTTEDGYGVMRDDNKDDKGNTVSSFQRGYITVNVNGGTIGNDEENAQYGGNVFGGSMGRLTMLDGTAFPQDHWTLLATAKQTTVNVSGGTIKRNVYGGGEMGTLTENTYVNVSGGTIGKADSDAEFGNVFGGGKGIATQGLAGLVKGNTNVEVSQAANKTTTIYHNIYGGGELGSVGTFTISDDYRTFTWGTTYNNTGICNVNITGGTVNTNVFGAGKGKDDTFWCEKGIAYSTKVTISDGMVKGNVYGGGEVGRVETNTEVKIGDGAGTEGGASAPAITGSVFGGGAGVETHGYSALVRGNTTVTVEGNSAVGHSVYGGGEVASVGRYALDAQKMPSILQGGGYCYVTVQGHATVGADVFGAGEGVKSHFNNTDEDLSRRSRRMTLKDGWESLVGAARFDWDYLQDEDAYSTYLETLALATHPEVTIGGSATIGKSVYGGGELGLTKGSVIVNIQGGTITEDVYGGGSLANTNTTSSVDSDGDGVADETVHPTTTVNLHSGTINRDVYGGGLGDAATAALVYGDVTVKLNETTASDNCVVKGSIFGCNNVNGTPKGHAKVHVFKTASAGHSHGYDVTSVFGGGKSADYVPEDTEQSTEVIIEGCDLTSIEEVYGGGYGAATPATNVLIRGTKIINNVFGGGYGTGTDNPGANVGFRTGGANYTSGDGKAVVQLMAGKVNNVYGGSNTKGDVRGGSNVTNVANDGGPGCCDKLTVGEIYGGGKSADMYGGAEIVLGCMPNDWIGAIYAGAESANVGNDVSLTLTSGKFGRVFGGNKSGGSIDGYIEVNIEENPECSTPIIIGELYGGGNEAPYVIPAKYLEDNANYMSPRVNVRAFTSIGTIYGGGFGTTATVTGNPLVNISEVEGGREYAGEILTLDDGTKVTLYPRLATSKMGVIGNVFGGGNAAKVIGNTNVHVGTTSEEPFESLRAANGTVPTKPVLGADIRGNVYGGGNAADVTGKTNVVIGKKTE